MIKSILNSRYTLAILVELLVAYAFWSVLDPDGVTSYWFWLLGLFVLGIFIHIKDSITLLVNFFRHRNKHVRDLVGRMVELDLEPPSALDFSGEDYLRRLFDGVEVLKPLTPEQLKFVTVNLAAIDLFRHAGIYSQFYVTNWTMDRVLRQFKSTRRAHEE